MYHSPGFGDTRPWPSDRTVIALPPGRAPALCPYCASLADHLESFAGDSDDEAALMVESGRVLRRSAMCLEERRLPAAAG